MELVISQELNNLQGKIRNFSNNSNKNNNSNNNNKIKINNNNKNNINNLMKNFPKMFQLEIEDLHHKNNLKMQIVLQPEIKLQETIINTDHLLLVKCQLKMTCQMKKIALYK